MDANILEAKNVYKVFPGVVALNNISFNARRGETLALVGENGAGKSTLIKVLTGIHQPEKGELYFNGELVRITSPSVARQLGIAVISQELSLVPTLSIAENMFLGYLPMKRGRVDWKKMYADAKAILERIHCKLNPKQTVDKLSVAEQQMVEIARALTFNAQVILMDEPSSSLSDRELQELMGLIRDLKRHGVTVIYISHRLEEIFEICDRVTVMRDGETVGSSLIRETDPGRIVSLMVGREIADSYPKRASQIGQELLSVNLTARHYVKNVAFTLRAGEILGIAGLVGAGRTEMARALFGIDYAETAEIVFKGKRIKINSPKDAIRNGMAFLTEDRKAEGLLLNHPLQMNVSMTNLGSICSRGVISPGKERKLALGFIKELSIKTPSEKQLALNLSGGNQQKVVLSKWLNLDAEVYILDEPTRGIDVGAKREIYALMNKLVARGKGIIFISSELPELIGMSDRVLVMRDGTISKILERETISAENIMRYAI